MEETETIQEIKDDMKAAMKSGDKDEVSTLRMLISSLNNAEIDKGGSLSDDDVIEVLSKEAKQRRESIDAYRDGGREDRAEKEEAELEVIQRYLPDPLSEEEAAEIVESAIEETGAETRADMGAVMGRVMPQVKGRYEGSAIKEMVLERLA